MKYRVFTVAILVGAVALYSVGMSSGALLLFAAGAGCELWFWARIFARRKARHPSSRQTHGQLQAAHLKRQ